MNKKINYLSAQLTQNPNLPAAKAMLYATGLPEEYFKKAQVGIVSNWYEGNPCNMHLNRLGRSIKKSVHEKELVGFRFNTIGVSDGISMGTPGMRYSLPSREIIADSIETVANSQHYDGIIAIPGCDKNMPGVLIALIRINRPSVIVYGGSIASGYYKGEKLDVVSSFEALGKRKTKKISEEEYKNIIKNSCPGAGACGGMYTANTMAAALEAMGMTLPYSSSTPAIGADKEWECFKMGGVIQKLLQKDIKPKNIITKNSLKNAISLTTALGGSTNLILHLLAIAKTAEIDLTLPDFKKINDSVPLIGNLKPSGKFLMEDIHAIGGIPVIMKYLLENGLLEGDCMTVTGDTLKENLKYVPSLSFDQKVISSINHPIKKEGHFRILYGNIAPGGSVAKITGQEKMKFSGRARVFNSEDAFNRSILSCQINKGEVIVIRYVGPKGGPGMPEMLKPTAYITGAGLGKEVALITDGRFSGGSHGFVVGHITPEAQEGGPIAFINDGDIVTINAVNNTINLEINENEWYIRRKKWRAPNFKVNMGYLYKYSKTVSTAPFGCVTDQFIET